MISSFRQGNGEQPPLAENLADAQLFARLQALDRTGRPGDPPLLARGRVWERLVSEHPALVQSTTQVPIRHPAPAATGIRLAPVRQASTSSARRSTGRWRAAMDIAAVAVLVIGLVLGARGVGIIPRGSNPNPLTTQSVAAAAAPVPETPRTTGQDEAGTNRQPGPGPQLAPTVEWTGEYASAVQMHGNRLYTANPPPSPLAPGATGTAEPIVTSPVTAYDLDPLRSAWTTSVPGRIRAFDVFENAVTLLSSTDTLAMNQVVSLDTSDGDVRWSVDVSRIGLGIQSNDQTILLTTLAGTEQTLTLLALDSRTGLTRWSRDLPASSLVRPVLSQTQIAYGTTRGEVHLLDAASGEALWVADIGANAIFAAPVIGSDLVYVITEDLVLLAFDRQTGDERWETVLGASRVPPLRWSGPTDEIRFDGGAAPSIHTGSSSMLALVDGQVIVQFISSTDDVPAHSDRSTPVAFAARRYALAAVDAATGAENWREASIGQPDDEGSWDQIPLVVDDDQIYVTTTSTMSARSSNDGHLLWRTALPFPAFRSPVVAGGAMYVVSTSSLLVLYEPLTMPGTATPNATPVSQGGG